MAERVFVRDLAPQEGQKLLSIIRRGTGSVLRWRRAQIVLWSAQHMPVAQTAEIAFTSPDRVREVIHNFNADGFDSLARSTPVAARRRSRCRNAKTSRRSRVATPRSRVAVLDLVTQQAC